MPVYRGNLVIESMPVFPDSRGIEWMRVYLVNPEIEPSMPVFPVSQEIEWMRVYPANPEIESMLVFPVSRGSRVDAGRPGAWRSRTKPSQPNC